jgi:hypothetical protein
MNIFGGKKSQTEKTKKAEILRDSRTNARLKIDSRDSKH